MIKKYPAPWKLRGRGYIILYRFKKDFVNERGNIPEFLKGKFAGGFGSIMLVDYEESNAGPYSELLFIPGKFHHKNKRLHTISKIYVSTMESVENGIENWAIPKEPANFSFDKSGTGLESVDIKSGRKNIMKISLRSRGLPFPVNTKLMPFPLVQYRDNKYYYTTFEGKGKGRIAAVDSISVNPELFPDVSNIKPAVVIKVEPFNIVFPEVRTAKDTGNLI